MPITLPSPLAALRPARRKWCLAVIAAASFMVSLDLMVVNVALPVVAANFGVGITLASKVVVVYGLVATCLVLVCGAMGERLGHKRLLLMGVGLFTLGSLLCGLAPGMVELIIGRAAQGLGAAMMGAAGLALVSLLYPGQVRGKALGLVGLAVSLGYLAGPALGGLVAHYLGWRFVFWLNLPVGAALVLTGLWALPPLPPARRAQGLDLVGAVLLVGGLFFLVSGLDLSKAHGAGDARPWLSLVLAAGCLATFIPWERRAPEPLLRLGALRERGLAASLLVGFFFSALTGGALFLLPFYLEELRGLGAHQAGLLLALPSLVAFLLARWVGGRADAWGHHRVCLLGCLLLCGVATGLSLLGRDTSLLLVALVLAVMGMGLVATNVANAGQCLSHAATCGHGQCAGLMRLASGLGALAGVVGAEHLFSLSLPRFLVRGEVYFSQAGLAPVQVAAAFGHAFALLLGLSLAALLFAWLARENQACEPPWPPRH